MTQRAISYALALIALVACSDPPSPVAPLDAGIDDAGSSDPPDSGAVVDPTDGGPTYPIDLPCDEPCGIRWRELAPLDQPIDHHTSFVLEREDGPYLYVLGGVAADALGTELVSYSPRLLAARIEDDGSLGAWESEDFGYGIGFHAQAQYVDSDGVDTLLWVGGLLIDPADSPPTPGGSPYTLIANFPPGAGPGIAGQHLGGTPRGNVARLAGMLADVVLHGTAGMRPRGDGFHDLFLIGGSNRDVTSASRRYDVPTDAWVDDAPLPTPRSHHAMVVHDRRLIVLGGFSGTTTEPVGEPSILRSVHDDAGHVTGWEEIGTLDEPPWTASAFVRDGAIYVVGGGISGGHHGDGEFLDRIRRAPIDADGHVGAFVDVARLPVARSHVHQSPVHGDHIYSIGGRIREGSSLSAIPRVFVGTFED